MIKNFTPLLDTITKSLDLEASAVYGRIWRYEQGQKKRCLASQGRIAQDLGLSTRTVQRRIYLLIEAGYLVDVTPKGAMTSHYKTTRKAGIQMVAYDSVPTSESHRGVRQRVAGSMTESHTKKQVRKTSYKKERVNALICPKCSQHPCGCDE